MKEKLTEKVAKKVFEEVLDELTDRELIEMYRFVWEAIHITVCFSHTDIVTSHKLAKELHNRGYVLGVKEILIITKDKK